MHYSQDALKKLKAINAKLTNDDIEFLRKEFGVPDENGEIPVQHIKVCYWSAPDIEDWCIRNGKNTPDDDLIENILNHADNVFDASYGMNWDKFDECCEDEFVLYES